MFGDNTRRKISKPPTGRSLSLECLYRGKKKPQGMNPLVIKNIAEDYKVWVLAPHFETDDPNLAHYYDFTHSIQEYTRVFHELNIEWEWVPVTMAGFRKTIDKINKTQEIKRALVLNLCDGDEVNGTPGVSVIDELEKRKLIYTGADRHFYTITTSKIPMKKVFDKAGVSNSPWRIISGKPGSIRGICQRVGTPLLLKPAVSGGSMGVSVKNVVHSEQELKTRLEELAEGYRGWNLQADGLFVERFITGPEFTTFITGSSDDPANCKVYVPVERHFHPSLPATERFLSFDRLWEIYEAESPMPGNENFYEYAPAPAHLRRRLTMLSKKAYIALGGKGYTRIDIRQDAQTGKLYVLEANAQCGLSEDEDYTSIGAILKASNVSYTQVIFEILQDAVRRHAQKQPQPTKRKSKAVL
jgi:D-alanine-D-alanine ligase